MGDCKRPVKVSLINISLHNNNNDSNIYLKSLHREWLPIHPSQAGLMIKVLNKNVTLFYFFEWH